MNAYRAHRTTFEHSPQRDLTQDGRPVADVRVCPSCRGRKVDRFDFDCTTCLGEGTVDE